MSTFAKLVDFCFHGIFYHLIRIFAIKLYTMLYKRCINYKFAKVDFYSIENDSA